METIKRSYILHLAGVFIDDIVGRREDDIILPIEAPETEEFDEIEFSDDEIEAPAIMTPNDLIILQKNYGNLPTYFTTKDEWVKRSNLLCWCCGRNFVTIPWFIPVNQTTKIETDSEGNMKSVEVMKTHGNFCLPTCCAYYLDNFRDPEILNLRESEYLLNVLYHKMTGQQIRKVPKCRNPREMIMYSGIGGVTEDEFVYDSNNRLGNVNL